MFQGVNTAGLASRASAKAASEAEIEFFLGMSLFHNMGDLQGFRSALEVFDQLGLG